jgi:hypothetical protein
MPRIPGSTKPLATLINSYVSTGSVQPAAQRTFDSSIPRPFIMTKARMESDINVIQEAMGQGVGKAPQAPASSDEANMLAKVRAKL